MSWESPYIVIRVEGGCAKVLDHINLLKDSRYSLTYTAQPGDARGREPSFEFGGVNPSFRYRR